MVATHGLSKHKLHRKFLSLTFLFMFVIRHNLHRVKFILLVYYSVSFYKHMEPGKHYHIQNVEQFDNPPKFPPTLLNPPQLHPRPLAAMVLFSILILLCFPDCYISGITPFMIF